jgi:hypothetical protein
LPQLRNFVRIAGGHDDGFAGSEGVSGGMVHTLSVPGSSGGGVTGLAQGQERQHG